MPTEANWPALIFPGWQVRGFNTASDGTGEWFTADTVVNASMSVFSIWTRDTLFFAGMGPEDTILPENGQRLVPVGSPISAVGMPPDPQSWPGHGFRNWNTSPDGTGATVSPSFIIERPLRIYAIWHTGLLFNATGGEIPLPGGWSVPSYLIENAPVGIIGGAMPNYLL